ncbi:MAG: cyclase family protein [Methanobrevibacter sp.]|nr:cyclase family protein [Methanobrevibacter sp.]
MPFIDLTHNLTNETIEFPGDPKTKIIHVENEDCNLFEVTTGLHTGTHMDAPFHYMTDGEKINEIDINDFIGKAKLLQSTSKKINPSDALEEIVIINTNWSKHWGTHKYFSEYPYLSIEFAERLVEENVKGVAIDTCSVDKHDENEIHKLLLKNKIWIVENIANSGKLKGKYYKSYFIPLKIEAEASPIRAFVKEI